jgi:uncharacterized protein involved in propanediol utilization
MGKPAMRAQAVCANGPGAPADAGDTSSVDIRSSGTATDVSWSLPEGKYSSGVSFGSFGELLQGVLPDGETEFLVTLPIEKYAVAHFFPQEGSETLQVFPRWKIKSLQLARNLLRRLSRRVGGQLYVASEIPCGKGLSSSSADLVATARAIESYLGIRIPMDELCRDLSQVEPTDGVMFSESVMYFHVKGALCERLGSLPQVTILSLDEGGQVDTLDSHHRGALCHPAERRREFAALFERLRGGFQRNALQEIGAVSTRSAYINQESNPKKNLERVHSVCQQTGGAGLITTHSGTCLGILYDDTRPEHEENLARAAAELRTYGKVEVYTTVKQPIKQANALDWSRFARK